MTFQMPRKIKIDDVKELGIKQEAQKLGEGEVLELDFSNLIMICSAGLGQVLAAYQICKEKDAQIRITNVESDYIRNMFKAIQLCRVIEII